MLKLIFRKPFKLLAATFFSFLLVIPSLLNIVAFVLPASAANCSGATNCYRAVITSTNGATILGFDDNFGMVPDRGQVIFSTEVFYTFPQIGGGMSTLSMSKYTMDQVMANFDEDREDEAYYEMVVSAQDGSQKTISPLTLNDIQKYTLSVVNSSRKVVNSTAGSSWAAASVIVNNLDDEDEDAQIISSGSETTNGESTKSEEDIANSETDNTTNGQVAPVTEGSNVNEGIDGVTKNVKSCSIWSGVISWLVCEVVSWVANAMNTIHETFIEPMLVLDPNILDTQSETYAVWGYFRDIANVGLIIYFLFIVFSQITGIGIDNYGIKKSLPRLIAAALLINLSYYICQLGVDLSNIIGKSIGSTLEGAAANTNPIASYFSGVGIGEKSGVAVAFAGALAAGVAWVVANPLIALTAVISALISYLFIFVILAIRWALVILLVVVAPVAFICYGIPNLKHTFDRWWKLLKTMLFLYPTCALCIGGGRLAARIILSAAANNPTIASTGGSVLTYFAATSGVQSILLFVVAVIAEVGPYFMIPSLTRSAMQLAGNIGAKVSQVGRNLGSGASRGIRNSDMGKGFERRHLENRTRRHAGIDRHGNMINYNQPGFRNRMRRFTRGGNDIIARNRLAYQKMVAETGSLRATQGRDFMLATETANVAKELVSTGDINNLGYDDDNGVNMNNDPQAERSLSRQLLVAFQNDDVARINAIQDAMSAKGEVGRNAFRAVYNQAVASGQIRANGARAAADNLMNKHAADYKNNARDIFNVMQRINAQGADAATMVETGDYLTGTNRNGVPNRARLALNATATTMGNMDDAAFEATFGGYNNTPISLAGLTAQEQQTVGAQAWASLHDQNANVKTERRNYLEEIVRLSGYQAEVRQVDVRQGNVNVANQVHTISDGGRLDVSGSNVNVVNEVDINTRNSKNNQVNPTNVRVVPNPPQPSRPVILGPNGQPLPPSGGNP